MAALRSATSTLPDTNNLTWARTSARWFTREFGREAVVWIVGDTWMLEAEGETTSSHMGFMVVPDARQVPLDDDGRVF